MTQNRLFENILPYENKDYIIPFDINLQQIIVIF